MQGVYYIWSRLKHWLVGLVYANTHHAHTPIHTHMHIHTTFVLCCGNQALMLLTNRFLVKSNKTEIEQRLKWWASPMFVRPWHDWQGNLCIKGLLPLLFLGLSRNIAMIYYSVFISPSSFLYSHSSPCSPLFPSSLLPSFHFHPFRTCTPHWLFSKVVRLRTNGNKAST